MNIFEQLNILLNESKETPKAKDSDIPIHPEMETEEQGKMAAYEKIRKLFQKLSMGSNTMGSINDGKPEIPDDMIDPMFKEPPKSVKDRTFEKNKLAGWDEEPDDKIEKEVELNGGDEDDEFDDFDYRNNPFGDEDDEENDAPDYEEDNRSEDEKLRDSIEDAIDSLDDDTEEPGGSGGDGSGDDESGANWGDDEEGGQQGGQEGKQQSGQEGGQQGGQEGKQQSGQEGGSPNSGQGSRQSQSQRQRRLEDLKKSLDSKGMDDFRDRMDEIKNATDNAVEDSSIAGQIDTPSDETFKNEMKRSGFDDKTIDGMCQKKNEDTDEEYNETEMEELKKKVIDGLEHSCEEKGGSALASTIVKTALSKKLNDDEWKELLKMFLKAKSVNKGKLSTANRGIGWGHKNHLWRDAVLPKSTPSKGTIQNIYCFVDFSGSVNKDLVYTFLGKVIDLCSELKYTTVKVYGFAKTLSLPRTLDSKSLSKGNDVALSQTWDFIEDQHLNGCTENFYEVTEEINAIKRKEKDAVILIFGDAYWDDQHNGPKCLRYNISSNSYLDDICVLTYFTSMNTHFAGNINVLKDIVGLKHVITTKASSIYKK